MATNYYADTGDGQAGSAGSVPIVILEGGFDISVPFVFTLPDTDGSNHTVFVANDTITLAYIPAGAKVLDYLINAPDMDSGSGLTLDLGLLGVTPAGFLVDSTVGQAGGLATPYNSPNGLVAAGVPSAEVPLNSNAQLAEDALGVGFGFTIGGTPGATTASGVKITGWVRYTLLLETVF